LYTHLGGGGTPGSAAWLGGGLGAHAAFTKHVWLDLDAGWGTYLPIGDQGGFRLSPRHVVRGRSTLGIQALPQLAPVVGASVNVELPASARRSVEVAPAFVDPEGTVGVWPGVFAGVQF
jgi:hypothetical protein